ncbi:MAG TPA: exosortase, partial [Phycisphaerae bacterium]|nr:exosortase [Phycisphaerae bacterium]
VPGRSRLIAPAAGLLLLLGLVCNFGFNFFEMWLRWFPAWSRTDLNFYRRLVEGESYYTHGPLILLLCVLMAWLMVHYTKIEIRLSRSAKIVGWCGFGVFMSVHMAACLARVNFISGFALIGLLLSLVLLIWGWRALRRLWFIPVFMAFMIPLPEVTIAQVNFRLKMMAADTGVHLADFLGVVVFRDGNKVFIEGGKTLVIANVCNGLRTIISLLAFGAMYAYVCRLRGIWRWFLFLMAVPVALLANTLRILSLIIVADLTTAEFAAGWYHDVSSLLIFVLAFLLLFLVEQCVIWLFRATGRPLKVVPLFADSRRTDMNDGQIHRFCDSLSSWRSWIAGVLLVLFSIEAGLLNRAEPPKATPAMLDSAMPMTFDVNSMRYVGYPVEIDRQTLTILENPGYLSRQYSCPDNAGDIEVTVFFSQDNRKGIHPPDLCLEGGGDSIIGKNVVQAGDVPCRALLFVHEEQLYYMLYTYKCGRSYTLSFWRQQLTIFLNGLLERNSTGALVRVATPVIVGDGMDKATAIRQAASRAEGMMTNIIPCIGKAFD